MSAVNPQNLPLTIGAGFGIATARQSVAGAIIVLIVYVVVASASNSGPDLFLPFCRRHAAKTLCKGIGGLTT